MLTQKQFLREPTNNREALPTKDINIERDTVKLLIKGDQKAFTDLYNAYAEKVFYFSLGFLKSEEDSENLTQEVFVKIWETRERLDPDYSFNAYLFTIARNTIFNIHRKRLNEIAYLNQLGSFEDAHSSKTEDDFLYSELKAQIDKCLDALPPQRQKVFKMSRIDGLSHKEISKELGIAEKTTAAHIRLALQTLRKLLLEE